AGTWGGASPAACPGGAATGSKSGSAPAASAATTPGGLSAAPSPGVRRQASGSESGARCSDRIRGEDGQRTAISSVEVVGVGEGGVVRRASASADRERGPRGRIRRHGQLAHDPRVEAVKAPAGRVGAQPRQPGEPGRGERGG